MNAAGLCWECMEKAEAKKSAEDEAARILAHLDEMTAERLLKAGLSKREIKAEPGRVPKELLAAVPASCLKALSSGSIPTGGFGLGSDTGPGKTMALAVLLKAWQRKRLEEFARALKENPRPVMVGTGKPLVWLSWPDTVDFIRVHAVDGEAESVLERAEAAPLLVLDDLGRERIKGSYIEDWAASQLGRIISHRYREELPILWTTNLQEKALAGIYGMAMLSRLIEDNPLTWVDGLKSQRLQ